MPPPPPEPLFPPPPPHAAMLPVSTAIITTIASIDIQYLRRLQIPKNSTQANTVPPPAYQRSPGLFGWCSAALVAAVVEIVSVAVPAFVPEIFTGLV